MSDIQPMHWSMANHRRSPRNMDRASISVEQKECATKLALSIFTDMSNSGRPFQDSLLAIYLSGLEHGSAASRNSVICAPQQNAVSPNSEGDA